MGSVEILVTHSAAMYPVTKQGIYKEIETLCTFVRDRDLVLAPQGSRSPSNGVDCLDCQLDWVVSTCEVL